MDDPSHRPMRDGSLLVSPTVFLSEGTHASGRNEMYG